SRRRRMSRPAQGDRATAGRDETTAARTSFAAAVEPPDVSGQEGREGAPHRVGRQRQSGPRVGLCGATNEVGAADRQHRGAQRGRSESVVAEEQPAPSGIDDQVGAQRGDVTACRVVTSRCAESLDGYRGGGRDVTVERGPDDGEDGRGWLVGGLAEPRVPAGGTCWAGDASGAGRRSDGGRCRGQYG